jgi:hypothetical protein
MAVKGKTMRRVEDDPLGCPFLGAWVVTVIAIQNSQLAISKVLSAKTPKT